VLLLVAALAALAWARTRRPPAPYEVAVHRRPPFAVPDFALVDQKGVELRRDELLGHVWVASFVFIECGETCTTLSRHLLDVMAGTREADVRFVSFSIGPGDGPRELAKFERRFPDTLGRWRLLAADAPTFPALATGLGLVKTEAGVRDGSLILFPALYLVDRRGIVRGVYDGLGVDGPRRLAADLAAELAR
jgi:protein SCO1/2